MNVKMGNEMKWENTRKEFILHESLFCGQSGQY